MDEAKKDLTLISKSPTENLRKYDDEVSTEVEVLHFLRRSVVPTYNYGDVDDKHKEYFDLLKGKLGRTNRADVLGPNKPGVVLAFKAQGKEDPSKSGVYLEDFLKSRLPDLFPEAAELERQLGEDLQFFIWLRKDELPIFIVQREDGKKSVLRLVYSTSRSIEDINSDIPKRPSLIPNFTPVSFGEGRIGVLIDFINGHPPVTDEEKQLCKDESQKLLDIPMLEYDGADINFIIEEGTGKPYYVDRDAIEGIVRNGLSPETAESRRGVLERGMKRMDQFG